MPNLVIIIPNPNNLHIVSYDSQNAKQFSNSPLDLDGCDFNIWLSDDISDMQILCRDQEYLAVRGIPIIITVLFSSQPPA